MSQLPHHRSRIRALHLAQEGAVLSQLTSTAAISAEVRAAAAKEGARLVEGLRSGKRPGLMEVFLAEYGLSTNEGVALMCLAEALLRVPDADTIDALIEDKIAPSAWGEHLGHSSSPLVNASTWALMLTGQVLRESTGVASVLRGAVKRLGEPVIRTAVARAIKELGQQFVLGETIGAALRRGAAMQAKGYTYSFDMLGEAAMTAADAAAFFKAYADAIGALASSSTSADIRENPGISIKLSALHPRYEVAQRARVMDELVPRVRTLALQAKNARMGLNIDAEEADRLDLSLDVIEAVVADPDLAGWDGFGVVVQAYGKRASAVIDWLQTLAEEHDRRLMVRLVKGAYWDTEIKRAQVEGVKDFPVYTRKTATDISYACCAAQLLKADRIYPQFATHNAHTIALINELAPDGASFEFQRLHGMGEALHEMVRATRGTRCRIYAPVGAHRDLLAYLVRRLLENGANSSFVNQVLDTRHPAEEVAADPFSVHVDGPARGVIAPADLFAPERRNSQGWDLRDDDDLESIETARAPFRTHFWTAAARSAAATAGGEAVEIRNPADPTDHVGTVTFASAATTAAAIGAAAPWAASAEERAAVLRRAADLYEAAHGEIFAALTREAGKALPDGVAELREAVDFLRYYAARGEELEAPARGVLACISPWNFPLAIFTGQIAACLAAGNAVVAKPAEATPLIADIGVRLLHEAGVPASALQLLPGTGPVVGAALSADPRISGVLFTGSTATAQAINRSMAAALSPAAPLVAETGGLNAMIVDSTALPEQAIRDIVMSAFRSAGQRCSALRVLYVQEDVAPGVLKMLKGAMDELSLGDPWNLATDVGPVIDARAAAKIDAHVARARRDGRVLHALEVPQTGSFVAPTAIRVTGIEDLEEEIFGPVLHVATFRSDALEKVIDSINASGYGLTFGMHSRIDDRVDVAVGRVRAGNLYINRNQIGAVVGSQPFGGEGLSGTGPKAGGPLYVRRLTRAGRLSQAMSEGQPADPAAVAVRLQALAPRVENALDSRSLPGPTGESNRWSIYGRGRVLCLGPTLDSAREQARLARAAGAEPLIVAPGADRREGIDGRLAPDALTDLGPVDAVVCWTADKALRPIREALAARQGPIVPLLAEQDLNDRLVIERHVCVDTTAAGGNARLLAGIV